LPITSDANITKAKEIPLNRRTLSAPLPSFPRLLQTL
jgi:hypothetical protein